MCFVRLPYLEEKPDYTMTLNSCNVEDLRTRFYYERNVKDWDFWDTVEIIPSVEMHYPAWTITEVKKIWIRPEWFNVGVLSHEIAHISHNEMNDIDMANFVIDLEKFKNNKYIKTLYKQIPYTSTNYIEGHANLYRFICDKLPNELKKYYPHLLSA